MKFISDLHVHSKYSRATAKNLDLENLCIAAQLKGITVVGTGDFTHPAWLSEIQEKLIPTESGLFRLREDIARQCDAQVPASCRRPVRFILQCEISNIYKKNGKTRKNHHVIFVPDIASALAFSSKLDEIGNIKSDGRPILGLDAKNLLEILLETSDDAFLIPAHIWTPWFSILGSKSGFDAIAECFEDLTPEIFAVETGLSSDPLMNWRVSDLDSLTLVSNSDAHSPFTLGRNANVFDTELSYPAIKSALKSGNPTQCLGTLDMYPEEGKYHFDGHRKCDICLHPADTMSKQGICPACGKPLTIGVLYRVEELADRPEGEKPEHALPFHHIIPLPEILSEILGVGPKTKKVNTHYQTALEAIGPELEILLSRSADAIEKTGIPLLGEAVTRMRAGQVHISPGYDGEYGKITVFDPLEKEKLLGQRSLFAMPGKKTGKKSVKKKAKKPCKTAKSKPDPPPMPPGNETEVVSPIKMELNSEQQQAVEHEGTSLLIIAGPGAGKTLTLTRRIAHLMTDKNVSSENILAVTFTNKAAQEMKDRLKLLTGDSTALPLVATFHALCFQILRDQGNADYSVADEDEQKAFVSEAIRQVRAEKGDVSVKPGALSDMIGAAKQQILGVQDDLGAVAGDVAPALFAALYEKYQALLAQELRYDYEDLIFNVVRCLESDSQIQEAYQQRFRHIFVDEYQDLNQGQYRIIRALSEPDTALCVIGDPDQSIYGFRGSDVRYFQQFLEDYPGSRMIHLKQNYRSAETILEASHQVIRRHSISPSGTRIHSGIQGIPTLTILETATGKAEAVAVGKTIENLVGGTGFHSVDFGKTDETGIRTDMAFSDFAVLYRSNAQGKVIADVFGSAGIPYQMANREHAYGRKGVSELISFLKVTADAGLFSDFQKIVRLADSGIGKDTLDKFGTWFYQHGFTLKDALFNVKRFPIPGMPTDRQRQLCVLADQLSGFGKDTDKLPVEETLSFLAEHAGLLSIIRADSKSSEAMNALLRTARIFGENTADFLEMIAFQTDPDVHDFEAQKVSLMTMHAAKGLEFPVVFVTGCENDLIPFRRPGHEETDADADEERRLFYVAMTRAKERLFLTWAKKRTIYGKTLEREMSTFVSDIEERLLTIEKSSLRKGKNGEKGNQVQLALF